MIPGRRVAQWGPLAWMRRSEQAMFVGIRRGGGAGADVELGEDVGEAAGNGLLAEDQLGRDLGGVAAAGGDAACFGQSCRLSNV